MRARYDEFRFVWLLAMVATAAFIWLQSTLPPAESAAASSSVADVLVRFLGGIESTVGAFVHRFIRKIAHFLEFFLLGAFSEGYFARRHTPILSAVQLGTGLFVAAMDEVLQLFTGRGALLTDVLLDVGGFLTAALLLRFFLFLTVFFIERKAGADGADTQDV